jgi:hypothetical protein
MIAVFSLEYGADEIWKNLTSFQQKEFTDAYGEWTRYHEQYVGDPKIALDLFKQVHLKRVITEEYTDKIQDVLARLERLSMTIKNEQTFNDRCDVHVGGYALMQVNEVHLFADVCTDGLQEELDKGWRIIAACVQPDGRRPDYILGRYNAGKDKK